MRLRIGDAVQINKWPVASDTVHRVSEVNKRRVTITDGVFTDFFNHEDLEKVGHWIGKVRLDNTVQWRLQPDEVTPVDHETDIAQYVRDMELV